jgi:hypothetical protein
MGNLTVEQYERAARAERRSRYRIVDKIRSKNSYQADRYTELKSLERAGKTTELEANKRIPLVVNGMRVDTYIATFSYKKEGRHVLVDANGPSEVGRLKHRLVNALLGVGVAES